MPKAIFIFLFALLSLQVSAQVLPKENSRLNYRIIGFSVPDFPPDKTGKIEIANGHISLLDSFKRHIIGKTEINKSRTIIEVPAFGKQYTWRVVYPGKVSKPEDFHHFSTLPNQYVDTTNFRLRIIHQAEGPYKDNFVCIDGAGVLYDMRGRPVWFMPDTNGFSGNTGDIKFTPDATITFSYRNTYEIEPNGNVLWKSPKKSVINADSSNGELFHHEFTKLANGHYMALCMEMRMCKQVKTKDSSYLLMANNIEDNEEHGFKMARFDGLVEYNEHGGIVWSWKSLHYLLNADFAYFNPADSNERFDPHANAFYFDQKNNIIYLGFRNLNRIIKIHYPDGKVLRSYGENFKPEGGETGKGLFCGQHNLGISKDGYLYYFNNNSCISGATPDIIVLQEPDTDFGPFKKIWEYHCIGYGKYTENYNQGGNVQELPDGSFFVNMGSLYSKLFIVNRSKNELWSALPERIMGLNKEWVPMHEYRATMIDRAQLERLIWKAETNAIVN